LSQSGAELHVGRFNDWPDGKPSICTHSEDLLNKYKKVLAGYVTGEFRADNYYCVNFKLPVAGWEFDAGHQESRGNAVAVGNDFQRTDSVLGWVDVRPSAGINKKLALDISLDVTIRYDLCSEAGGCDTYTEMSTSPPALSVLYFDILPGSIKELWTWADLVNDDPDGDDIPGYISQVTKQPTGPDANLCPNLPGVKTWEKWDSDGDGLSDYFEKTHAGFDPCDKDSDNDGMNDGRELLIGTFPNDSDTDNDGLNDHEEDPYSNGTNMVFPWLIPLSQQYPGRPNPIAFPNPRHANFDADHRNDKEEKAKLSSPTSFNAIPVGAPLPLSLGQSFKLDGSQTIIIQSAPWANAEAVSLKATLVLTLPVAFSNVIRSAKLHPPAPFAELNTGTPLASGNSTVYRWALPPLSQGRFLQASLTGKPAVLGQRGLISAALEYDEGAVHQRATAQTPLLVNEGGPIVTLTNVIGAVALNGLAAQELGAADDAGRRANAPSVPQADGMVSILGLAEDPDRISQVFVCVKTSGACAGADWKPASQAGMAGGNTWVYHFDPPADNVYHVRAYAVDSYGKAGAVAGPLDIGVDQAAPASVQLDLGDTAFLSTTTTAGQPLSILLTGRLQDAPGALYVSGAGSVGLLHGQEAKSAAVTHSGQPSSAFSLRWSPPVRGRGMSVRSATGDYQLIVGGSDLAGNAAAAYDTVRVVVDDTPPVIYAQPPQTSGLVVALSGLADDTALVADRASTQPFAAAGTTAQAETRFTVSGANGKAVVVGDVSGDEIADVVLLVPATTAIPPAAFRAGLFFGKPGGLPANLDLNNADVLLQGETPIGSTTFGPAAAGVGDVNGDGVGDLLLGDPAADSAKGRAYLVFGRRSGWTTPLNLANASWKLNVANTTAFGGSVAGAGDVNGDGLADLLVGAAQISVAGVVQNGRAWLYLGREQTVPPAQSVLSPPGAAIAAPPNLAGLGDTNGDGLSDFLVAFQNTP
ncbi:MAG: hypothetical protein QG637_248, partial [Chloroflexota bacterium]|nr:hypothetical protein [Chloroflexota bacterium]